MTKQKNTNRIDMADKSLPTAQLKKQTGFSDGVADIHYNSGKPAGFGSPEVIQLFPDYSAKRTEIDANQHLAALEKLETEHIRPRLQGKVNYRYGGSFAAFLKGARRIPNDIDVEVETNLDVATAADEFTDFTVNRLPDGHAAFCTGNINFDFQGSQVSEPIAIDIVNEENPAFTERIKAPSETGEAFATGDLSGTERIVMNYLDRLTFTPSRVKDDDQQIVDVLHSEGRDLTDIDNIDSLCNVIDTYAKTPAIATYLKDKLRSIQ